MSAAEVLHAPVTVPLEPWATIIEHSPRLAATVDRYLDQLRLSLRPRSVEAADNALRIFCNYLVDEHPEVETFEDIDRSHIEGFKRWLGRRRTRTGQPLLARTIGQRLRTLRAFFDRITEWDWPEAPARTVIFASDLPIADDPLPRFLDDGRAARLMRSAAQAPPLDRLVVELLAHTGIRVSELCQLEADAMANVGAGWWLRVPVGKLHDDRFVPLLPTVVERIRTWSATHDDHGTGLLLTKHGRGLSRHQVGRILARIADDANIGHVHPHQLRHTLATQAINRGMRLEAIAAMLGHRSLRMTMTYARIADRTVADEFHAANEQIEALYVDPDLPETPSMRQLRNEHRRMLGNGWCTRPRDMGCTFESICEGCGFFATTVEFKPTLRRQRDHATANDQPDRQALYDNLLESLDDRPA